MCSCSLFFYHRRSFSPWWPLTFLIFLPPLQNFHVGLQQKMSLCFFPSRSSSLFLVELCLPVALLSLFLCPSLSLYSKFVDMTINLSLILALDNTYTETFSAVRFRLY